MLGEVFGKLNRIAPRSKLTLKHAKNVIQHMMQFNISYRCVYLAIELFR